MTITKNQRVSVEVTPDDIAALFWNMDNIQQAEFFNRLAEITTVDAVEIQMMYVSRERLTDSARKIAAAIATAGELPESAPEPGAGSREPEYN